MKLIELKRLTLSNWRGQSRKVDFEGRTDVYGKNKTGKSSLKDAFLWLLTGYDSNNRMNFNLFDNNMEYTAENNPEASVEGVFLINDNEYSFKRTAKMGFVRKRGNKEYERKGTDDYKFLMDGIEMSATEYRTRINELFAEQNVLRIMLDTTYFLGMEWKDQRTYLSLMSGEIKKEDYKGKYDTLFEKLDKYTMEEIKSQIATICDPIKAQLKSFPLTIQTLEENLPDISKVEEAKKNIENDKIQIKEIEDMMNGTAESIKPFIDKRNKEMLEISTKKNELINRKKAFEEEQKAPIEIARKNLDNISAKNEEIKAHNDKIERDRNRYETQIKTFEEYVKQCEQRRTALLAEKNEEKEKLFGEDTCPVCGQSYPESKLGELRASFEEKKKNRLETIIAQGKANNSRKDSFLKSIQELKEEINSLPEPQGLHSVIEAVEELRKAEENWKRFEDTEEYASLMEEIHNMEENLTVIPEQDNAEMISMKETFMKHIEEESKILGLVDERKKQEQKIENLKKDQRAAAEKLAEQEQLDYEIKEYEEERAKIVSDRVNRYFKRCHITMMSQDKSGKWIPNCVITALDGANSATSNGAERILLGVDISNAFAEYFGISLPLFVDDVNLINDVHAAIQTKHQLISLIVSEDESLIVKSNGL